MDPGLLCGVMRSSLPAAVPPPDRIDPNRKSHTKDDHVKVATAASTLPDTRAALAEAWQDLRNELGEAPSLVLAYYTEDHDSGTLAQELVSTSGTETVQGSSSCLGVMSTGGFYSESGVALGLWGISDADGAYGVGAARTGDTPRAAASRAVEQALMDAERPGEIPDLVWLHAAPGAEEEVIKGIADVLGPDVPVAGGSSGDNTVAGDWSQFVGNRAFTDAITVSVFFPSTSLSYSFHSGYEPTLTTGRVTKADGRVLLEIDGRPAAQIYNEWTGGCVEPALPLGGSVLSMTTLFPLGREVGRLNSVPYFELSHPESVTAEGGIALFTEIGEGEEITLMTGSTESLIDRAGRVARQAIVGLEERSDGIAGALVIYCAGCMLTVQDSMDQVAGNISMAMNGAQYMGIFTFGEQGCFMGGENRHGNLMISIVAFGA